MKSEPVRASPGNVVARVTLSLCAVMDLLLVVPLSSRRGAADHPATVRGTERRARFGSPARCCPWC